VTRGNIVLYAIIGVLLIIFTAVAYKLAREHSLPEGARFELGPNGTLIEKN
jgi:hypothetical protein